MVTTRRQSGKFSAKGAPPNYADSSSDSDDDDGEEYEFPEKVTGVEESDEDEYKGGDKGNVLFDAYHGFLIYIYSAQRQYCHKKTENASRYRVREERH